MQFDYENQHLEAEEAHYNVSTGRGTFMNVRGTIKIERRANPTRADYGKSALVRSAVRRKIRRRPLRHQRCVDHGLRSGTSALAIFCAASPGANREDLALVNANFRLFRVPLIWLPYATAPAGPRVRESGFLIPNVGNSTSKGFVFGDAFYWAPRPWMDTTVGSGVVEPARQRRARGISRQAVGEHSIKYSYFGVVIAEFPRWSMRDCPTKRLSVFRKAVTNNSFGVQSLLKE